MPRDDSDIRALIDEIIAQAAPTPADRFVSGARPRGPRPSPRTAYARRGGKRATAAKVSR